MKSNLITEEEKNRILNMHKKRSANHYLVEQGSGNNPTPKKRALTDVFLKFLTKYKFKPSDRFQMSPGGEGGNWGPYSPDGSICYKSNDCKTTKDPQMPWLTYTTVRLEFDLKPTTPYVYIIIEQKDSKKVTHSVGNQKMKCLLDQKSLDNIILTLQFDVDHNRLAYGC